MNNSESLFLEACRLAEERRIEEELSYYNSLPDFEYSKRFEKKMQKLCKQVDSGKYSRKSNVIPISHMRKPLKILLVAAIMISLLSITALAIEPIREGIKNFFVERYPDISSVEFKDDDTTEGSLYSEYTWIPEGYILKEHKKEKLGEFIVYEDAEGHLLVITSNINEFSEAWINTEGITVEDVIINQTPGIYYSNRGDSQLLWSLGKYNYSVLGEVESVTKEDLIRIAENRKNAEKEKFLGIF